MRSCPACNCTQFFFSDLRHRWHLELITHHCIELIWFFEPIVRHRAHVAKTVLYHWVILAAADLLCISLNRWKLIKSIFISISIIFNFNQCSNFIISMNIELYTKFNKIINWYKKRFINIKINNFEFFNNSEIYYWIKNSLFW